MLPTGQSCEDSWITATGLSVVAGRLKYLVAMRLGVTSPTFAARQTAALDRLSNGRLLLNVVVGGVANKFAVGDYVGTKLANVANSRKGRIPSIVTSLAIAF